MLIVDLGLVIAKLQPLGLLGQLDGRHFHLRSGIGRLHMVEAPFALGHDECRWYHLLWLHIFLVFVF